MPFFEFNNIKISAISSAVPKKIIKTDDYKSFFTEAEVNRFKYMTGIEQHRVTNEYQTASDLGFVAAEKIIAEKKINRDEIGALAFVAHSTDYLRPATACVLHKRLNLSKNCAAFDINLGCSAVVYGVQTLASMMSCSNIDKALLIVGETLTKMIHPKDKSAVMLFGDGGGALLLEKSKTKNVISGLLKSDGNGYKAIIAPAGGFRNRYTETKSFIWKDGNERSLYNTNMNGTDVFSFTITDVPETVKEFFELSNSSVADYDCFAFHQANKFIHKQLSKKLKIPFDKMPLSINRYGNTSAPAILIALCDEFGISNESKIIKTLFCGFGVGLSWGVLQAEIDIKDIYPVIETDDYYKDGIINSPDDL